MKYIVNARIESTMLGYESHGVMTFFLYLKRENVHQGFGGYGLDMYDQEQKKRVSHKIFGYTVSRILEVVGVDSWEKLNGKYIRMELDSNSWGARVIGIGNILKDIWFYPEEEYKCLIEAEEDEIA